MVEEQHWNNTSTIIPHLKCTGRTIAHIAINLMHCPNVIGIFMWLLISTSWATNLWRLMEHYDENCKSANKIEFHVFNIVIILEKDLELFNLICQG